MKAKFGPEEDASVASRSKLAGDTDFEDAGVYTSQYALGLFDRETRAGRTRMRARPGPGGVLTPHAAWFAGVNTATVHRT